MRLRTCAVVSLLQRPDLTIVKFIMSWQLVLAVVRVMMAA
jgi:hypothetical protein